MPRVYLILALLAVTFWVYSIVDCALQPPTRHRGVTKPVWILIVVVFPVIGGVLWFAIGRSRRQSAPAFRAPDDDPEFLGRIVTSSDQDERIRRLEEELAALDSEGPDPRDTPGGGASGGAAAADAAGEAPTADDESDGTAGPRGSRG